MTRKAAPVQKVITPKGKGVRVACRTLLEVNPHPNLYGLTPAEFSRVVGHFTAGIARALREAYNRQRRIAASATVVPESRPGVEGFSLEVQVPCPDDPSCEVRGWTEKYCRIGGYSGPCLCTQYECAGGASCEVCDPA